MHTAINCQFLAHKVIALLFSRVTQQAALTTMQALQKAAATGNVVCFRVYTTEINLVESDTCSTYKYMQRCFEKATKYSILTTLEAISRQ